MKVRGRPGIMFYEDSCNRRFANSVRADENDQVPPLGPEAGRLHWCRL